MQFSITPVDLHHYDFYQVNSIQSKLLKKSQDKTYIGSATINLNGNRVDLYCENKLMKKYSEMLGKQALSYYETHI